MDQQAITQLENTVDRLKMGEKEGILALSRALEALGVNISSDKISVGNISDSTGVAIGSNIQQIIYQESVPPELESQLSQLLDLLNQQLSDSDQIQYGEFHIRSEYRHSFDLYLRRLQRHIEYVRLSRITPRQRDVLLSEGYIPVSTDLSLSLEVKDGQIAKWWISKRFAEEESQINIATLEENQTQSLGTGVDQIVIDALIGKVQGIIDGGTDYQYDDPSKRPLILAPSWYDGIKTDFWPVYAIDAVAAQKRIVLLGPPGSGKSTFAKHLTLCLLSANLESHQSNVGIADLGIWPHGPLVPIFIELRKLVNREAFPKLGEPVTEEAFWDYIRGEVLGDGQAEFANELERILVEGHGIIIFDGLDEVPIPPGEDSLKLRREQLKELARSLSTVYYDSKIVFTSRPYAYREDDWVLDGFTIVNLAPLDTKQMEQLASRLYIAKGLQKEDADSKAEFLLDAMKSIPSELKDYPLFLALMATLFLQSDTETLPTRRGTLYNEIITLLLDRWTQSRVDESSLAEQIGVDGDELYKRLELVAYKTHQKAINSDRRIEQIDLGTLLEELFYIQPPIDIHGLLAYLSGTAGVLVSPKTNVYEFAHRSLQEYLAASYIVQENGFEHVRTLIEEAPLLWREPGRLVGDILAESGARGAIWDLVDTLIGTVPEEILPPDHSYWWSIWLASRIFLDQDVHVAPISNRDWPVVNNLFKSSKMLLQLPGVLNPPERSEIAKVLGLMGDDRSGVGLKNDLPDIAWSTIPEGEFQMGITEEQIDEIKENSWSANWSFSREKPAKIQNVSQFKISRYPITIMQFETFINSEDGYLNRRWWTDAGWEWFERIDRRPPVFSFDAVPNLPCTNISWYEAVAFCNWLSEKLNYKVRLPTELEWEKAARGSNGRFFAWGNDFDPGKCNMRQSGISQVCSVGCFTLSESPWGDDGPLDMCGNVWEWCSTIYEKENGDVFPYPYAPDERENLEYGDNHLRVVRGGSYLNPPFLVRTSFRGRDKPTIRYDRQGFRIVTEAQINSD